MFSKKNETCFRYLISNSTQDWCLVQTQACRKSCAAFGGSNCEANSEKACFHWKTSQTDDSQRATPGVQTTKAERWDKNQKLRCAATAAESGFKGLWRRCWIASWSCSWSFAEVAAWKTHCICWRKPCFAEGCFFDRQSVTDRCCTSSVHLHSVGDTCQTGSAPRICESPPKAGERWNGEREEGEFHSMCWWSGRRRPCIRVQRTVASHGSLEHQCSRQNWASQCIVCSLPQQGARLGQNSESAILA